MQSFENLNIERGILDGIFGMGYNCPSDIQRKIVSLVLSNPTKNIIAQDQSGTGKTAALIMAMLLSVDANKKYVQILCVTPTAELANQTFTAACKMSKYRTDIDIRLGTYGEHVVRGEKLSDQLIIGTPTTIFEWANGGAFDLQKISMFVIDEADSILSTDGFEGDCIRIHKQLKNNLRTVASSTLYDDRVMGWVERIAPNATILPLNRNRQCPHNLIQYYMKCPDNDRKLIAIQQIYGCITIGQAIIFCDNRTIANWLLTKMSVDGHSVALLSKAHEPAERIQILARFDEGIYKVLIVTDILLRGIAVQAVTLVMNWDMPKDVRGKIDFGTYLHRIGRTGRFGIQATAINLINSDLEKEMCVDIETHFSTQIFKFDPEDDYDTLPNSDV